MYLRIALVAAITILTLSLNASALPPPDFQSLCLQYKPYSIDISSLRDFYETLTPDEKEEQLRDWAFYGLLISLGIKPSEIENLTGMDFPMRYSGLRDKMKFQVLPGRTACPDGNDCVILIPSADSENNLLLGFVFDKLRLTAANAPKRAHIFAYSVNPSTNTVNTSYIRTVAGKELFSAAYGYIEKEISRTEDLKEFLDASNSIISVKINTNSLVVGGRKNAPGAFASLSFEDIAVLQQAYINQGLSQQEKERKKSYETFLKQKYFEVLKKDARLRKAVKSGKVRYIDIMTRIRKVFPYSSLDAMDSNVGFSLDPLYDYGAIAEDLKSLSDKAGRFAQAAGDLELSKTIDSSRAGLLAAGDKVKSKKDISPLLRFRRRFADSKDAAEQRMDSALRDIELENTFQIARYDGKMRGTTAAMILFYTDLTAKLWALDYNGLSPRGAITGFLALSEIKVPKLYWESFVKLSKTRLWFGLRSESYDINGNEILFEPVSTRVYAASSDPLYPGKESEPNYQSGEFLEWWDRHYASVADYEPYYYKLNELLKWSCIMMALKEKHSACLDFLSVAPVQRSLDFEDWYKNSSQLKNKTPLPFVDRNKFSTSLECFKILQSKGYPLMGSTFYISGGVSLASKKDITAKLAKHKHGERETGRKIAAKQALERKNKYASAIHPAKGGKTGKQAAEEPAITNDFGNFTASAGNQAVKLQWNKNEGAVLDECVNSLVSVQENAGRDGRSENIFRQVKDFQKAVRIETGKTYLVKSGALKDKWIYLLVDPAAGKTAGFSVKAAGSQPDSSVFYAKTISSHQAENIISKNKGVVLFE